MESNQVYTRTLKRKFLQSLRPESLKQHKYSKTGQLMSHQDCFFCSCPLHHRAWKTRFIWSSTSKILGHLTLIGRYGSNFISFLCALILGCSSWEPFYTYWIIIDIVYLPTSSVACTTNMNDAPLYSCAGGIETSFASACFLEQSSSKEESHNCASSSSIIW